MPAPSGSTRVTSDVTESGALIEIWFEPLEFNSLKRNDFALSNLTSQVNVELPELSIVNLLFPAPPVSSLKAPDGCVHDK